MYLYKFKLKHNYGFCWLTVAGPTQKDATNTILNNEFCPESAILKVTVLKKLY